MNRKREHFIGIEGGGTKTIAIISDAEPTVLYRVELGPGNLRLLNDGELREMLGRIAATFANPHAIGIGMAGARTEADRERVRKAVAEIWGSVPVAVTNDLEIALEAQPTEIPTRVLVLSGTGSCCFGRRGSREAKVGGWGHLLGDRGSGHDIAINALRETIYQFDRNGRWGPLGEGILRALVLNEPNELIAWVQRASKAEIAALAPVVFATSKDAVSKRVLETAAESLARDAVNCALRLVKRNEPVAFVLSGSVLLKQPEFAKEISGSIKKSFPKAEVVPLQREAAWGAVELARQAAKGATAGGKRKSARAASEWYVPEFRPGESPTEQRNRRSMRFHELSTRAMMDLMLETEGETLPAVRKERKSILAAVELAAKTLQAGGRIFYVGAGTSGRLGILDASECPPTFRVSPEMVQGIIAGGQTAIWQAVEGAEDDAEAGARAMQFRGVKRKDVVIGIAASGRTPFVWGALGQARKLGVKTVLICFNPALKIETKQKPDVLIAPNLGPEILTGSTRLKSGTATKIILNTISTIAMVRIGKVVSNLMVDLNPSNVKLRDRAIRIIRELTGCSAEDAQAALEKNGWVVKKAWAALKKRRLGPRQRGKLWRASR
ncbi:MAG TPA: N-acetylmuramic acid 6-phosphate etherase [Verrucomicrobiae bacterium]